MFRIILSLLATIFLLVSCKNEPQIPLPKDGTSKYFEKSQKPFYHGVASGDPLQDRVIIWTRVTPEFAKSIDVKWKIGLDESFSKIINSGNIQTDSTKDYTVKIDAGGLAPSTQYFYQFEALGKKSSIGRTKTLPKDNPEKVKFAIVSCSNFEAGYFNAFGRIAEKNDLDAVLHLGDYIYEYGIGTYGDTTLGRLNLPKGEIIELSDYRTRYALYRLDKDFQKVHQNHPFITIWDDHELMNNAYKDGAQNHQEDEGDFHVRKNIAKQVYYEWLPVREGKQLYRQFQYGNLVNLLMLDERYVGRTAPVDSVLQSDFQDSTRTMLGFEQRDWFFEKLKTPSKWQVVGNQVIFSELSFGKNWYTPLNLDAWDGYPYEQQKIKAFLLENKIQNTIFVTGDTHSSWAFETSINGNNSENESPIIAAEFGTTSVSSANSDERNPVDSVLVMEKSLREINPHLKYVNLRDHGYLLLTLTNETATAEWRYVETVKEISKNEKVGKTIILEDGKQKLLMKH